MQNIEINVAKKNLTSLSSMTKHIKTPFIIENVNNIL